VVLGVLGVLLLAVAAYVLTSNQISSRTDAITRANNEKAEAQARAAALGSYESFSQVKQTRVQAVKLLAQQRFDWERLSRELAHVLPSGVSLTGLEASVTPTGSAGASSSANASAGANASDADAVPQPTAKLSGCARNPDDVAILLVRLRRLYRADEVDLNESVSTEEGDAAGPSGGSGGGGAVTCGSKQHYTYTATVKFSPAPLAGDQDGGNVPASLGGGS
jgi:Tfp pilus assembly protein PilN